MNRQNPTAWRVPASWPLAVGILLLGWAMMFQNFTLISGDYTGVLWSAFWLTALADILFIYAFWRGGAFARVCSVVCLLPTLFVIGDDLRRGLFVFSQN